MEELMHKSFVREGSIKDLQNRSHRYWLLEWLRRREMLQESGYTMKDPGNFQPINYDIHPRRSKIFYNALVLKFDSHSLRSNFKVLVPELGKLEAYCIGNPRKRVMVGDVITVQVKKVDPITGRCVFAYD